MERKPFLEEREGRVDAALLKDAERVVDDQAGRNHQRLKTLPDRELEDDRRFEHPRYGRPEVTQDLRGTMQPLPGHRVGPYCTRRRAASAEDSPAVSAVAVAARSAVAAPVTAGGLRACIERAAVNPPVERSRPPVGGNTLDEL
jgi:hypothetical protein